MLVLQEISQKETGSQATRWIIKTLSLLEICEKKAKLLSNSVLTSLMPLQAIGSLHKADKVCNHSIKVKKIKITYELLHIINLSLRITAKVHLRYHHQFSNRVL